MQETENRDTWQFLQEDMAVIRGRNDDDAQLWRLISQPFAALSTDLAEQTSYINRLIVRYQALYARRINALLLAYSHFTFFRRRDTTEAFQLLRQIEQLVGAEPEHGYEKIGTLLERVERLLAPGVDAALRHLNAANAVNRQFKEKAMILIERRVLYDD